MPLATSSNRAILPPWIPLATGRLYGNSLAIGGLTTLAVTIDILYACPIKIPYTVTLTAIGIEVTTGATGNVRIGMYTDVAGVPTARLFDSGAISTAAPAAFKSAAISQTIVPGNYWIAGVFSATPTVRAVTTANSQHDLGSSSGTDTAVHSGVSVAFTYAALPDPFTGGSALHVGNLPNFLIQP